MTSAYVDGITTTYAYRGDGLRKSKTVDGVITRHVWDGDQIVQDRTGGWYTTTEYVRGIRLIDTFADGDFARWTYIQNTRGDVIGFLNGLTSIISEVDYDAFGNQEGLYANDSFGYCGEYRDAETGFIYLRARYYDPTIGRFTTEDPARDGLNWYVYCNNNPIAFVDPSGLEYGKLRTFVEDYAFIFNDANIQCSELNGQGYAFVTLDHYCRTFYFDGTIVDKEFDEFGNLLSENRTKIADNINGTLYLERSAFVAAMRMLDDGGATISYTDPIYVSDFAAMSDFLLNMNDSFSVGDDIKTLSELLNIHPWIGTAGKIAATTQNILDFIKNDKVLVEGKYRTEIVSVYSPYKNGVMRASTLFGIEQKNSGYQWITLVTEPVVGRGLPSIQRNERGEKR